ncbi:hypothetical protein ACP4OV_022946 [Aristida adscensionis]
MATARAAPAARAVLPDELLEEVFLRLDDAADLARAAAACVSFLRVVSGFLRRLRSLHPPPVLGLLDYRAEKKFYPAEPPHRPAPAARALAQAFDLAFSSLPVAEPQRWVVRDVRGGRVLLADRPSAAPFPDLMVVDPLRRRYVGIPPIPDDLAAACAGDRVKTCCRTFLDPASEEEKDEEHGDSLSFRLICAVHSYQKLAIFNFSSATGKWRGIAFDRSTPLDPSVSLPFGLFQHHYAHGCFYFTHYDIPSLFMLDGREMKFSFVDDHRPTRYKCKDLAIVEAGKGRLGMLICGDGVLDLYSTALPEDATVTVEWQHDKIIPLPETDCLWKILDAAEGYVLLQAAWFPDGCETKVQYFTMDLKTLLV